MSKRLFNLSEVPVLDQPLLFGKYCLLERISVGGMAEVFRAKPLNAPNPDQYFAVKRILPHLAEDVEFIKMFVDEARLTVQLNHDNIVETYELGQFQSSHYIVMEFIAGKDLLAFQKHVRNEGTILNVDMACHIIREVAKGLDYAHNKTDGNGDHLGIIHRDVSPQNILVSWDGRVRVIDFGIAKAASQSTQTRAGVMKGKFGYMSPEQVKGEQFDHRADIFAMGTVLWELLTNRRLFKAGNQLEAMTMIGDPQVEPPSTINDAVPPEVDAIVMKMLQPDPDRRYHWGADLASDLGDFLSQQLPPFHPSQLTTWIRSAFRDDFDEERDKREKFRGINTAEDVRRRFSDHYGEGGEDDDQQQAEATEVWDVDEAPESDADIANFVADHTVVQAGGLDPEQMEEWDDVPDTIDETQEVVADRLNDGTFEQVPSAQVEVAAESQYEAEATVVTGETGGLDADATAAARPVSLPDDRPGGTQRAGIAAGKTPTDTGSAPSSVGTETGATGAMRPGLMADAPTPPTGTMTATGQQAVQPPKPDSSGGSILQGKNIVVAGAATVAVVVLGGIVAYVTVVDTGGQEVIDRGDFVLQVEPADSRLQVFVDDHWMGNRSPVMLEGLEPATYTVQIDHPDYPHWRGTVDVMGGEVTEASVDLGAVGQLELSWEKGPEEAAVFVDGEPVTIDERSSAALELARGSYLVEAFAPGMRPIRRQVRVREDEAHPVELKWTPDDQILLRGDKEASVKLDGRVRAEELPVILTELERDRIYELEVGEHRATGGYPLMGKGELDMQTLDRYADYDADDYGWLMLDIAGEGPWNLVIDDSDTGLVAPLEEGEALPVLAGQRTIGFERGEWRHDYEVDVVAGETTILRVDPAG